MIDDNGEKLGVFSKDEAIKIAEDKGLDLLQITFDKEPCVAKILDYGKHKFDQKKKQSAAKKQARIDNVKDTIVGVNSNQTINSDPEFKKKILDIFEKKFLLDQTLSQKLIDSSGENSSFDNFKNKFLDGDLTQILIYIWEKILSIGEEDDFEIPAFLRKQKY